MEQQHTHCGDRLTVEGFVDLSMLGRFTFCHKGTLAWTCLQSFRSQCILHTGDEYSTKLKLNGNTHRNKTFLLWPLDGYTWIQILCKRMRGKESKIARGFQKTIAVSTGHPCPIGPIFLSWVKLLNCLLMLASHGLWYQCRPRALGSTNEMHSC